MINATIVLEGGATRGVFTSGVLDYLMEQDTYLSHVIGVSAGACNAVDYVSKQIGRTRNCMIVEDKEYNYHNNLRDFMREKSLLDMDMVFDKYPREIFPFDFETFQKSCEQGVVCEQVTTNCITGKAEYMIETQDFEGLDQLIAMREITIKGKKRSKLANAKEMIQGKPFESPAMMSFRWNTIVRTVLKEIKEGLER